MTDDLSPIDKLLDPDNQDNIVLYNARDEKIEFEQVAAIPIAEDMYVILSPIEDIAGASEDEGLVFKISSDEDGMKFLALENDSEIVNFVFEVYNKILDDAEAELDAEDLDDEDFDDEDFDDEDFDDDFDDEDFDDEDFDDEDLDDEELEGDDASNDQPATNSAE